MYVILCDLDDILEMCSYDLLEREVSIVLIVTNTVELYKYISFVYLS